MTNADDWDFLAGQYGEEWLRKNGFTNGKSASGGSSNVGSFNNDSRWSDGTPIDKASVTALGMGPISYDTLERLVESGKVIAGKVNGKLVFTQAGAPSGILGFFMAAREFERSGQGPASYFLSQGEQRKRFGVTGNEFGDNINTAYRGWLAG